MTDDTTLSLFVPEDCPDDGSIYDGHYGCPVCDEPFDDDVWTREMHGGGGRGGGVATYSCPNDCDGTVTVSY